MSAGTRKSGDKIEEKNAEPNRDDLIALPGRAGLVYVARVGGKPDGEVDVLEATALFTNILEGWIRQYPEQWLWVHRRWKK